MDLAEATLFGLFRFQKMETKLMNYLIVDTLNALKQLNQQKIIHRDIKPDNILMMSDGSFKLGDFGTSKQINKQENSISINGTPGYFPPEIKKFYEGGASYLTQEEVNSIDWFKFDVFSLGLSFAAAVCQIKHSIEFQNLEDLLKEQEEEGKFDPVVFKLIKVMTKEVPVERPSPEELLEMAKSLNM